MSGAGGIKADASDDETLCEIKDAVAQYALRASDLALLHHQAVIQGKTPIMVVTFANGMEAEIHVHKRRRG